jgi:hypothetical protein
MSDSQDEAGEDPEYFDLNPHPDVKEATRDYSSS